MKQIEIIEALLSGYNNIEQMGTYDPSRGLEYFGVGTYIVQGNIDEESRYVYIYEKMLRDIQKTYICNCRLRDNEGCEIRLYKIED